MRNGVATAHYRRQVSEADLGPSDAVVAGAGGGFTRATAIVEAHER